MLASNKPETRANATFLEGFLPSTINSSAFEYDTTAEIEISSMADAVGTLMKVDEAGFFKAGDYITVQTEVMRIVCLQTTLDTDLGTGSQIFVVERAKFGSTGASHATGQAVNLYYQNSYFKYNSTDYRGAGDGTGTEVFKTNNKGDFYISNFFGYGRTTANVADGIVPGSVAIQFMKPSVQKFGLSGIASNTKTGLTAGTQYSFKVNDSGGGLEEIVFTTSASNLTFGGTDGLLNKIQTALNEEAITTSGNLDGRQLTVHLVNGDFCVYNENRTTGSSLVFAVGVTGTSMFTQGVFPAYNALGDYSSSYYASIYKHDSQTYVQNVSLEDTIVDDGKGKLGSVGTINYETGAITLTNAPSNAEMKVWGSVNSAHSGGNSLTASGQNQFTSIRGRSVNARANCNVRILAYE